MFYSGLLTERKDMDVREAAALRQRRMKQAVQFNHKDSADLLPLDGLKNWNFKRHRCKRSRSSGLIYENFLLFSPQPHNILQRRLMETNMSRLRHSRGTCSQKNDLSVQTNKLNQMKLDSPSKTEEEDLILICCQCAGKELQVVVDTGCQRNIISSACLERLGLKEHMKSYKAEGEKISLPHNMKVIGHLEHLPLTMGTVHVDCSAVVVAVCDKLGETKSDPGKTDKEEIPLSVMLLFMKRTLLMHEENVVLALEKEKYCVVESEDLNTSNINLLDYS